MNGSVAMFHSVVPVIVGLRFRVSDIAQIIDLVALVFPHRLPGLPDQFLGFWKLPLFRKTLYVSQQTGKLSANRHGKHPLLVVARAHSPTLTTSGR